MGTGPGTVAQAWPVAGSRVGVGRPGVAAGAAGPGQPANNPSITTKQQSSAARTDASGALEFTSQRALGQYSGKPGGAEVARMARSE